MLRKLSLSAAIFAIGFSATAAADSRQDFVLTNKTGYTINEVYVSPSSSGEWEEDVMGRDALANGERVKISFTRAGRICNWDLMVVYEDGESAEWEDFNLCKTSKITIRYDRRSGETSAEYE